MGKLYRGSSGGGPGKVHDNISCVQVKQAAVVFTFVTFVVCCKPQIDPPGKAPQTRHKSAEPTQPHRKSESERPH